MTAGLLRPPDWTHDANCAGHNPAIFDADTGPHTTQALAICATCPVRLNCAREALDNAITGGTWGGLTTRDRARIARARGFDPPGAARHGTRARFVAGCTTGPDGRSCDDCREAHRRWAAERRALDAWTRTPRQQASA